MEKNTLNNNNNNDKFAISNTTNNMLALLRDFIKLQNKLITTYDEKTGGESVIEASAELYHCMQDAITANICETLTETQVTQL